MITSSRAFRRWIARCDIWDVGCPLVNYEGLLHVGHFKTSFYPSYHIDCSIIYFGHGHNIVLKPTYEQLGKDDVVGRRSLC